MSKSKVISVRKCVISSQTSLVYRVNRKSIELLVSIDNRSQHSYSLRKALLFLPCLSFSLNAFRNKTQEAIGRIKQLTLPTSTFRQKMLSWSSELSGKVELETNVN